MCGPCRHTPVSPGFAGFRRSWAVGVENHATYNDRIGSKLSGKRWARFPAPREFISFPNAGDVLLGHEEDAYAARIARNMWRMAKRRAAEISAAQPALNGPMCSRRSPSFENTTLSRDPPRGRSLPPAESDPRTLAEFLQALAAELASDEPDPDES